MGQEREYWYEFEQVEILPRPFWVKARTAKEARAKRLSGGVPDFAGSPSDLKIIGRGRRVRDPNTIECIEARIEEVGEV
jgi:hypothetical protein